jgi:hypothetical protein
MISRQQIIDEIQGIDQPNLEILYHIIEALKNSNGVVVEAPNTEEKNLLKGSILYEGDLLSPIDEAWVAEL